MIQATLLDYNAIKLNTNKQITEKNLSFGNFKHFIFHSSHSKEEFETEVHFKNFLVIFVCLFFHINFQRNLYNSKIFLLFLWGLHLPY